MSDHEPVLPTPPPTAASWLLVQAIAQRLAVITVANGYRTDIGLDVRINDSKLDEATSPRVLVIAQTLNVTQESSNTRQSRMEFAMVAVVPANRNDAQATAHAVLADISDAFPPQQRWFSLGDGNTGVEITDRSIEQRPDGAALVVAQITARAVLIEKPVPRDLT